MTGGARGASLSQRGDQRVKHHLLAFLDGELLDRPLAEWDSIGATSTILDIPASRSRMNVRKMKPYSLREAATGGS